ncbi:MAG TPA: AMP-dependent synthetase, partial [Lentzea sp.]
QRWGERPAAVIVVADGHPVTADELRRFLARRVPSWWLPDQIERVAEIPRTGNGKHDKRRIREMFAVPVVARTS